MNWKLVYSRKFKRYFSMYAYKNIILDLTKKLQEADIPILRLIDPLAITICIKNKDKNIKVIEYFEFEPTQNTLGVYEFYRIITDDLSELEKYCDYTFVTELITGNSDLWPYTINIKQVNKTK